MRDNGRPPIPASSLQPNHLNLRPGEKPAVVCPDCGIWRLLNRRRVIPHRSDKGVRCPGSAQRIILDLTTAEWAARLVHATRQAAQRRQTLVSCLPPAPAPAVSQMRLPPQPLRVRRRRAAEPTTSVRS